MKKISKIILGVFGLYTSIGKKKDWRQPEEEDTVGFFDGGSGS